ncbi:ribonuclease H-like domain-containing protein, partial [Tanacetum coccineum]
MVTRYRVGTNRPTQRYTLNVSTISPIPKSYSNAFRDPNWYRAMLDEYNALIKNNTWVLVPRPLTRTLFVPCGSFSTSIMQMAVLIATRLALWRMAALKLQ